MLEILLVIIIVQLGALLYLMLDVRLLLAALSERVHNYLFYKKEETTKHD